VGWWWAMLTGGGGGGPGERDFGIDVSVRVLGLPACCPQREAQGNGTEEGLGALLYAVPAR
jgi:hypothetical protein